MCNEYFNYNASFTSSCVCFVRFRLQAVVYVCDLEKSAISLLLSALVYVAGWWTFASFTSSSTAENWQNPQFRKSFALLIHEFLEYFGFKFAK